MVQLGKQILKLFAVCFIIFMAVHDNLPMIYNSAHNSPHDWMIAIEGTHLRGRRFAFSLFLVAVALLDFAYQRWQYRRESEDEQG